MLTVWHDVRMQIRNLQKRKYCHFTDTQAKSMKKIDALRKEANSKHT